MKYPKIVRKLLENKIVYYIVLFLAITNLFGYLYLGNFAAILLFFIAGGITYALNKNKTLILFVALVVTAIFMMGKTVKEGFDKKNSKQEKPNEKQSNTQNVKKAADVGPTTTTPEAQAPATKSAEPSGKEAQTDGMYNRKQNHRIDYASTIEEAYGNLNKILGSDGIKGLTDDTQKLMKQQLQLAEAMKNMTPLVKNAQDMLKGLDLGQLGGIADLAKQFTGMTNKVK